jgi:hypothetical protein
MEQAHEASDIPRLGDIAPFAGLSGARKQAADQIVRHIEHPIGEPGLKINDRGDKDRASSVRRVTADLMRIRDAALADKLLKTIVMGPRGGLGRDAHVADKTEPVEQRPHMVRLRKGRSIPQPAKGRRLERRIGDEQRIELGELRGERPASRASAVRLRARARPAMAVRLMTAGAGRMIFAARRAAITPVTIGWPRSVLQADCAADSIMKGTSVLFGGRRPSVLARRSAWSVMVCGRSANHPTRASIGSSICVRPMPGWRTNANRTAKPR